MTAGWALPARLTKCCPTASYAWVRSDDLGVASAEMFRSSRTGP